MKIGLGELGKKLDAILDHKLDIYAQSVELVRRCVLTSVGGTEDPISSLAISILKEHLETGEYPMLKDYAEAARKLVSSEWGLQKLRETSEEFGHRDPEERWLFAASMILAIKVRDFCISRGLIKEEKKKLWGVKLHER